VYFCHTGNSSPLSLTFNNTRRKSGRCYDYNSATAAVYRFYLCLPPAGLSGAGAWLATWSTTTSSGGGGGGGTVSVTNTWGSVSSSSRPSERSCDSISSRRLSLLTRSARQGAPTLINRAWQPTAYNETTHSVSGFRRTQVFDRCSVCSIWWLISIKVSK